MRLKYSSDNELSRQVFYKKLHTLVELYIRDSHEQSYTLIALAGDLDESEQSSNAINGIDNEKSLRTIKQGPYVTREQALGALSAIVSELQRQGFYKLNSHQPLWELQAQQSVAQIRKCKQNALPPIPLDLRNL